MLRIISETALPMTSTLERKTIAEGCECQLLEIHKETNDIALLHLMFNLFQLMVHQHTCFPLQCADASN